jgi:hypothetical protein
MALANPQAHDMHHEETFLFLFYHHAALVRPAQPPITGPSSFSMRYPLSYCKMIMQVPQQNGVEDDNKVATETICNSSCLPDATRTITRLQLHNKYVHMSHNCK